MIRLFASLLLVAQLGAFGARAFAAPLDGHSHHLCGAVLSTTASVEAQSGADCATCDMTECGSMLGCSAVSPALVAEIAAILTCPVVPEPGAAPIDQEIDFYLALTSPPPKR